MRESIKFKRLSQRDDGEAGIDSGSGFGAGASCCGGISSRCGVLATLVCGRLATGRQVVMLLMAGAAVFLLLTVFSPAAAYHRFMVAFRRVSSDFSFTSSRDINDCGMYLWTRRNLKEPQILRGNVTAEMLNGTFFDKSLPVKILFHGFSDSASTTWTRKVKHAYLREGSYNVFSVDWRPLARSPWYSTAVNNAAWAGEYAAAFIDVLTSPAVGVDPSSIHAIGASLGAHAAAAAGARIAEGGRKIGRLTGLDPSGPLHYSVPRDLRLDEGDAQFVDVIHTAGKWVGNHDNLGHVDFFPNLGSAPQPGCAGHESLDLSCSHFLSWKLFSNSIKGKEYLALKCDSTDDFVSGRCCMRPPSFETEEEELVPETTLVGEDVDRRARGRYYLYTAEERPKETPEESVDCKWIGEWL